MTEIIGQLAAVVVAEVHQAGCDPNAKFFCRKCGGLFCACKDCICYETGGAV